MNKTITLFIIFFIIIGVYGCPESDFGTTINLTVKNTSSNDIVVFRSFHSEINNDLPVLNPYMDDSQISGNLIESNSENKYPEAYRELFEIESFNLLTIILFSKDTIDQVSWERIRDEYLILRRYNFTLEDLEALDWTIEYP